MVISNDFTVMLLLFYAVFRISCAGKSTNHFLTPIFFCRVLGAYANLNGDGDDTIDPVVLHRLIAPIDFIAFIDEIWGSDVVEAQGFTKHMR